jgi:hypothetical protein
MPRTFYTVAWMANKYLGRYVIILRVRSQANSLPNSKIVLHIMQIWPVGIAQTLSLDRVHTENKVVTDLQQLQFDSIEQTRPCLERS